MCCGNNKKLGLRDKVKGAAQLAKAEAGIGRTDEQTRVQRQLICEGSSGNAGGSQQVFERCEHYDFGKCRKCGCYLWAKVRLAKQRCRIGKW